MKRATVVFLTVTLLSSAGIFAQSRLEKPNDLSLELLGRGLLYSMFYQRMLSSTFGLEVGASVLALEGDVFFPVFAGGRLYLSKNNISPTLSGGIAYYFGPHDDPGPYFYIGPGFEYRTSDGFVARAAVYLMTWEDAIVVWPGITLGICF